MSLAQFRKQQQQNPLAKYRESIGEERLSSVRNYLMQRDKQANFRNAQQEAERYRQEAEKANNWKAKTGEFIFGGGLKSLGKEFVGSTLGVGQSLLDVVRPWKKDYARDVKVFGEEYPTPFGRGEKAGKLQSEGKTREALGELGLAALDVITTFVAPTEALKFLKGVGIVETAVRGGIEGITMGSGYGYTGGLAEGLRGKELTKSTAIGAGTGLALGVGLGTGTAVIGKVFSKLKLKKAVDTLEKKHGRLSIGEIALVDESLKLGAKEKDISKGLKEIKTSKKKTEIAEGKNQPANIVGRKVKVENKKKLTVKKTVGEPIEKQTTKAIKKAQAEGKSFNEFIEAQDKVYHGTNAKFDEFDTKKIGSQTDAGLFGHGFYFTENKDMAKIAPRGGAKYIKEVVINRNKLLDLKKFKSTKELADYLDVVEGILVPANEHNPIRPILSQTRQFASHIQEKGFDGVIVRGEKGSEIVVYNQDAVKTTSQLRKIWEEEKTLKKSVKQKEIKKPKSQTAVRLNKEKNLKLKEEYETTTNKKLTDKAVADVRMNKDKALKEAMSGSGNTKDRLAKLNTLATKAENNGDIETARMLFQEAQRLSTDNAQSLNYMKSFYGGNNTYKYMSQLVEAKMKNVGLTKEAVGKAVQKEVNVLEKKIAPTKETWASFVNELKCK